MITGYMTTTEAAKYLNYDPDYICALCIQKEFPGATKFGNAWAIPEEDVITYRKKKTRKNEAKKKWLMEINAAIRESAARKYAKNLATA